MPRENYKRIAKGYEPREPVAFPEQVFYLLRFLWEALKVGRWRLQEKASKFRKRLP